MTVAAGQTRARYRASVPRARAMLPTRARHASRERPPRARGHRLANTGRRRYHLAMAGNAKFISSGTRFGNGAGAGDGWGGPAKGRSVAKPRADASSLIPGQSADKRAISAANRQTDAEIAEELRGIVLHLARYADRDETRLAAACKLLDRVEGLPVPRVVSAADDEYAGWTDDELKAEIDRLTIQAEAWALPKDPVEAAKVYERLMRQPAPDRPTRR